MPDASPGLDALTEDDVAAKVAELEARGAIVEVLPQPDGGCTLLVAWPLGWDAPRFRDLVTGRDEPTAAEGQCVPRRLATGPAVLPRPGPVVLRT